MLSVIIPAYNEKLNIEHSYQRISDILSSQNIDFEIIYIDDGSTDGTWTQISSISGADSTIHGVRFSRNFGKEAAIFAGLEKAEGECVAVIDCDLQHPPEKLVDMFRLWEAGFEVIEGVKSDRGNESLIHGAFAKLFYKIINTASDIDMERASDFKLLDRKAVNVLLNMKEKNAFFRALSSWVGFSTTSVEFEVEERISGESKWSSWALMKYAVNNITSFSSAPMQIVTFLGVIMLIISVVLGMNSLIQKINGTALGGFTTVIIIELFVGSIIMISLGVIGIYISKIYEEVKARPRFIITDEL
ncbi:MAG: glycosyltransferase family 2 protein [Lachnospiraceae bacterium]|nr:glycosyltransferase family 2 protein [Lachnospiraceae bacterium]